MKKIFAILLTVIMIATIFIGCRNNEESEPVNATEPAPIETVDESVDNLTENVSDEKIETDSTVIDNDTSATEEATTTTKKAVTTTKKNTAQTTTKKPANTNQATTKKAETTTKKNTATTTKKATVTTTKPTTKAPATTKKPVTTTKPATTKAPTTTKHTHNYNIPVYAEKQVLVKAAWDEDIYETKKETAHRIVCDVCGLDFGEGYKAAGYNDWITYCGMHGRKTGHKGSHGYDETITTKVKVGTKHHPAEYKTEKYVKTYKCTCGATK